MAMVVKNNMSAVRTLNTLNANSSALQKSLNRVSSGMKINSAQDDAAGYAISERMRVRIRSLDQANQNTQNDSSLMKTAEGAVGNTVEILRALKEKAINAANDSNTDEDRQTIQKELNQFIDQIDDNALVQFNGKYLVDGSKNNAAISTKTVLLNQSLSKDNYAGDALTDLKNRAGDSLGIQNTDKFQVSWVQNGVVSSTSGDVGSQTLDDILKAAKIPGTVARTDDYGLVGTTEANANPMADYANTNMTLNAASMGSTVTNLTLAQVQGMLGDLNSDFGSVVNAEATTANETATISGLRMNINGTDTEVALTVKCEDATSGSEKYSLTLTEAGKTDEIDISTLEDTSVYMANTPDKTLVDKDGNAMQDADYVKAPTNANVTLTDQADINAAALIALVTSINGTTPTSGNDAMNALNGKSMGDFGYYVLTGTGKEDGDVYAAATGTKFTVNFDSTNNDYDVTISGDKTGFYKFDDSDLTTQYSIKKFGSSATAQDFKDTPSKVTVEVYDDSPAVSDPCDKSKKDVYTPDKTAGIAFVAEKAGVKDQISGLTINIMDQDGNVKKAANAALDQFKQYQRAENETGDMSLNFHIGSEANVAIKVGLSDMRSEALGLKGSNGTRIDVYTKEHANAAINVIENALTKALDQQTTIGAIEARLEYTSTNLTTSSENVQAAESTIRDADMAKEMTNYTKSNVLLQAAQAMLAQANQNSSAVLSLLQ